MGDAIELFTEDLGGKGETLIFVHGLGGTVNTWHPQTQVLKGVERLICYVLQGAGRSPLKEHISIDTHLEDLEQIIKKSGEKAVHLAGHSMGTIVCQHLA